MIVLLFKLIFGLVGIILSLIWWMVKVWFAVFVGLFVLGLVLLF